MVTAFLHPGQAANGAAVAGSTQPLHSGPFGLWPARYFRPGWMTAEQEARVCDALRVPSIATAQHVLTALVLSECAYKRPDSQVLRFSRDFPALYPEGLVLLERVAWTLPHAAHRYVVAESPSALFVAFMGTKDPRDLLSDVNIRMQPIRSVTHPRVSRSPALTSPSPPLQLA